MIAAVGVEGRWLVIGINVVKERVRFKAVGVRILDEQFENFVLVEHRIAVAFEPFLGGGNVEGFFSRVAAQVDAGDGQYAENGRFRSARQGNGQGVVL